MDEQKIMKMYNGGGYTLRHLAELFKTNHHKIKEILLKNDIKITRRNTIKKFSNEHRKKIGDARRRLTAERRANGLPVCWNEGKTGIFPKSSLYRNMKAHLKYDVSLEWLEQFYDIEKLKYLNHIITRNRYGFTTELYKQCIEKFYHDKQFNLIYEKWIASGKVKYRMPSLDHIHPRSKGGEIELGNMRFITWFENRCKNNLSLEEWEELKSNIQEYFI